MQYTEQEWPQHSHRVHWRRGPEPQQKQRGRASAPRALVPYSEKLFERLHDDDDQVVADSLVALGRVARLTPSLLWQRRGEILRAYEDGSHPVRRAALCALAAMAGSSPKRRNNLAPFLVETLRTCRKRELVAWVKIVLPALPGRGRSDAAGVLSQRLTDLDGRSRRHLDPVLRRHYWSSGLATFPGIFLTVSACRSQ